MFYKTIHHIVAIYRYPEPNILIAAESRSGQGTSSNNRHIGTSKDTYEYSLYTQDDHTMECAIALLTTHYHTFHLIKSICILLTGVSCGLLSESNGTAADDIDALTLVDLGKEARKPLLTLIGLAMRNLHPCDLWSPWTPCEANARGYYGTRTRTRKCVDKRSSEISTYKNETDIGLCEGKCPFGANITTHGFCFNYT
ncbi:hypothetical protein ACF0H5_009554 [Mactra antiquata]